MRLVAAFSFFTLLIMLMSGTIIFVLHDILDTSIDFWFFLVIFWIFYVAYAMRKEGLQAYIHGWRLDVIFPFSKP